MCSYVFSAEMLISIILSILLFSPPLSHKDGGGGKIPSLCTAHLLYLHCFVDVVLQGKTNTLFSGSVLLNPKCTVCGTKLQFGVKVKNEVITRTLEATSRTFK